ncbi:hypothetical protein WG899_05200 [Paucibacter sp. AS339]|uniref:hypothetical protein n=1 Tax=Paucibacter hankyongi TaxID=3133434 RepID=UPI0030964199
MQPASAPVAPALDTSRASGTVSVTADTLDASGRKAGVAVELHQIQADGSLGPIMGVTSTASDGSFSIAMPAGSSTSDGSWMLVAKAGSVSLRAYLYPGAVRVDVGSEAWVREVIGAAGRVLAFPGRPLTTVGQIAGTLGLYADATGDQRAALAPSAAADQIVRALASDHAMSYVVTTLRNTGTLPSEGTGDIGAFYAMSNTYAAFFVDGTGQQVLATLKDEFGRTMTADGSWGYNASFSTQKNAQWQPVAGSRANGRLSASRGYQTLTGSGTNVALVSYVVGEFPAQSFPVQAGARQLDARRITDTKLNFTGGSDIQPMAFSVTEQIGAVESISVGAGSFRAVRVVTDQQIVVPKSASTVTTLVLRSTVWVAPGVGVLKETDQVIIDGTEDKASASSLELTNAYANGTVWPAQLTIALNYRGPSVDMYYCVPVVFPALRRVVTVEYGPPVQSTPTLALALWDMDTGAQVGTTRNFSGILSKCPVPTGDSSSLLVAESFPPLNLNNPWPKTAAEALALSDVVHQVSGKDLAEMATYTLPAVPDAAQPTKYWPVVLDALFAAPDGSGRFVAGFYKKNYFQTSGEPEHYTQVLGPTLASPLARVDNELLLGVDWTNGRFFSSQNIDPLALRMRAFSPAGGVDVGAVHTIRSGNFVPQIWYISNSLLHLMDGSTIRISDGAPGPKLPYTSNVCALGYGTLVCVDSTTDQLVKLDPDTLAVQARAGLGSYLRSWSQPNPDFRISDSNGRGMQFLDESTLLIKGFVVHVGRWAK